MTRLRLNYQLKNINRQGNIAYGRMPMVSQIGAVHRTVELEPLGCYLNWSGSEL